MKYIKTYESHWTMIRDKDEAKLLDDIDSIFDKEISNVFDEQYHTDNYMIDEDGYYTFEIFQSGSKIDPKEIVKKIKEINPFVEFSINYDEDEDNYARITYTLKHDDYEFQKWLAENHINEIIKMKDYILPEIKNEYPEIFDSIELGLL